MLVVHCRYLKYQQSILSIQHVQQEAHCHRMGLIHQASLLLDLIFILARDCVDDFPGGVIVAFLVRFLEVFQLVLYGSQFITSIYDTFNTNKLKLASLTERSPSTSRTDAQPSLTAHQSGIMYVLPNRTSRNNRIMLNIKHLNYVSNAQIHEMTNTQLLINTVRQRQKRFVGHILRMPEEEPLKI